MSNHSTRAHAILSASGSSRWLNCTPSARLEEGVKETGRSIYADEGTLAHELAELKVRFQVGEISSKEYLAEKRKKEKHELYNPEMEDHVEEYLNFILGELAEAKSQMINGDDPIILTETRVDFSHIVPHGFGSLDNGIISDKTLWVIDFKYGKGIQVFSKLNSQLMLYSSGMIESHSLQYDFDRVKLCIVQPRLGHIDVWETSTKYIQSWAEKIVKPKAQLAIEGEGEKQVGDWCRFCKVSALCTALKDHNVELAKHDFKDPNLLSLEDLVPIFEQLPLLKYWAQSVEDYLLAQALEGKKIPGYKPVEGRSMRKWADEEKVEHTLRETKYKVSDIMNTKLGGIGQIERLVGKDKFGSLLGNLIVKPPGKPTLAPIDDKRPSIVGVEQAKIEFQNES